jgi:hypothetical protein
MLNSTMSSASNVVCKKSIVLWCCFFKCAIFFFTLLELLWTSFVTKKDTMDLKMSFWTSSHWAWWIYPPFSQHSTIIHSSSSHFTWNIAHAFFEMVSPNKEGSNLDSWCNLHFPWPHVDFILFIIPTPFVILRWSKIAYMCRCESWKMTPTN